MPREHAIVTRIKERITKSENRLAQLTMEQCALEEGIKQDRALLAGAQPKQPRVKRTTKNNPPAAADEKPNWSDCE